MSVLRIKRQELFAQFVAEGVSYSEAFRKAGYSCRNPSISGNASNVAHRPGVQERINELIEERQEQLRGEIDGLFEKGADLNSPEVRNALRMWIIKSLHRNAQLAREAGKTRDHVHALQALAAFAGIEGAADVRIRADRESEDTKPVRKRGVRPTKSKAQNVYDAMDRDRSTAPTGKPKMSVDELLAFAEKISGITERSPKGNDP